jgi:RHS repeat-associated protein
VDTVTGADNTDAAAAGLASGTANDRTRSYYDADGNVVAQIGPRGFTTSRTSPNADFMTATSYDADGRVVATYTPRFDSALPSATDEGTSLGISPTQSTQCPTSVRPPAVLASTPPPSYPSTTGVCVTSFSYDFAGNRTGVVLPTATGASSNRSLTATYTDDNLVASIQGPNPQSNGTQETVATYLYDADGQVVTTTDANNNSQTTSYFADHHVDEVDQQAYTNSSGTVAPKTIYGYDANGNQTTATDGLGHSQTATYYSDNLVATSVDGAGDTTSYAYDADGNPTQQTSPSANARDANNSSGTPSVYLYTEDNLVCASVVPHSATQSYVTNYTYDPAGRKTSQDTALVTSPNTSACPVTGTATDAGPQSFTYNPNDTLASETGHNGSGAISYTYDPAGHQTAINDTTANNNLSATYYLDGLVRSVDDGTYTSAYSYDGLANPATRTDVADSGSYRNTDAYTWTDAETLASDYLVGPGSYFGFGYDAGGRNTGINYPSGSGLSEAYTYNPGNTLATATTTNGTGQLASWTYQYDSAQLITSQAFTETSGPGAAPLKGTDTFSYDAANRVTSFTNGTTLGQPSGSITWDHDSNRLTYGSSTFGYNADNSPAWRTVNGTTVDSYEDSAGNIKTDSCANYTYDGFDRLTSSTNVTSGGACPTGSHTSTYTYDGLDRLRSETVTVAGTTTTADQLHYSGLTSTASVVANSTAPVYYHLTPDGQPLALTDALPVSSTVQYIFGDGQGDNTTVTTSSGDLACATRFDPFGTSIDATSLADPCAAGSDTANANSFFYRDGFYDPNTGDYQFGSRTYDPTKGYFLTPDSYRNAPATANLSVHVDPLTENTYTYVNGDPVNLVDPTGHDSASGAAFDAALYQVEEQQGHKVLTRAQRAVAVMALAESDWMTSERALEAARGPMLTSCHNPNCVATEKLRSAAADFAPDQYLVWRKLVDQLLLEGDWVAAEAHLASPLAPTPENLMALGGAGSFVGVVSKIAGVLKSLPVDAGPIDSGALLDETAAPTPRASAPPAANSEADLAAIGPGTSIGPGAAHLSDFASASADEGLVSLASGPARKSLGCGSPAVTMRQGESPSRGSAPHGCGAFPPQGGTSSTRRSRHLIARLGA